LRILFDNNVPVGVRRFLVRHEVRTVVEMNWPPQSQQNLTGRKLALVVLGSNIWPIVRAHAAVIAAKVDGATPGSYEFVEMPLPPRSGQVLR
jgi:hypothetical protein